MFKHINSSIKPRSIGEYPKYAVTYWFIGFFILTFFASFTLFTSLEKGGQYIRRQTCNDVQDSGYDLKAGKLPDECLSWGKTVYIPTEKYIKDSLIESTLYSTGFALLLCTYWLITDYKLTKRD